MRSRAWCGAAAPVQGSSGPQYPDCLLLIPWSLGFTCICWEYSLSQSLDRMLLQILFCWLASDSAAVLALRLDRDSCTLMLSPLGPSLFSLKMVHRCGQYAAQCVCLYGGSFCTRLNNRQRWKQAGHMVTKWYRNRAQGTGRSPYPQQGP